MNRKGQLTIGVFIMTAVALIVGLVIFTGGIAPNVGTMTQTRTIVNTTVTSAAAGSAIYLSDTQAVSSFIAINATTGAVVPATNYTLTNYFIHPTSGSLTVRLASKSGESNGKNWNISYVSEPLGYVKESGGRSMAVIIGIFLALAIAIIALVPAFRSQVIDFLG